MKQWFLTQTPVNQALVAGLFTWIVTAIGASGVFWTRSINRKLLDSMLGFSGGVMLAASYWSLLAPAIEISKQSGEIPWLPATVGFLSGAAALYVLDQSLPHLHVGFRRSEAEGPSTQWQRSTLLVVAITLHNIPEGLAVGVAFAGAAIGLPEASLGGAVALALGIGIQNFPEGIAVAMPLRAQGVGRLRSFWYGQASAAVEPVAAVLGAYTVLWAAPVLPYALSFAAGAMIYVVVEELIPESTREGNVDLATMSLIGGFTVMMVLDVALG